MFRRFALALGALACASSAYAQTALPILQSGVQASGTVLIDHTGAEKGTAQNPIVTTSTAASGAAVVSGDQTYTAGTTQTLTMTPSGRLKVGLSSATNIAPGALAVGTTASDLVGCQYNAGGVTFAAGNTGVMQCDGSGRLIISGSVATTSPAMLAATSTPLTGTASTIGTVVYGPFTPQLARDVWVTIVGTGASGKAQLLRSTDGGATQLGLTAGGSIWDVWPNPNGGGPSTFSSVTGVIVNEQAVTPSDAVATYYLSITLTAGSVTYRVAQ